MAGTIPKAPLLLMLVVLSSLLGSFSLALVACSTEPPAEPEDRPHTPPHAPPGTLAEGAGDPGLWGETPRQPSIEGARLQRGVEGEQIIVVVGQEGLFPKCFLVEVPAVQGVGREGVNARRSESLWPKEGATETAQVGESYVVVFHEDPQMGAKVADPRKTPYRVMCVEAITKRVVEAHIEGTPKGSPKGISKGSPKASP